jgi:hypothetical protein
LTSCWRAVFAGWDKGVQEGIIGLRERVVTHAAMGLQRNTMCRTRSGRLHRLGEGLSSENSGDRGRRLHRDLCGPPSPFGT